MASCKTLKVLQIAIEFELYPESNRPSQKRSKSVIQSDLILKYPLKKGRWNGRERVHAERPKKEANGNPMGDCIGPNQRAGVGWEIQIDFRDFYEREYRRLGLIKMMREQQVSMTRFGQLGGQQRHSLKQETEGEASSQELVNSLWTG